MNRANTKDYKTRVIDGITYASYSTYGEALINRYLAKNKPKGPSVSLMENDEGEVCFVIKNEEGRVAMCGESFIEKQFDMTSEEIVDKIIESNGEWFYG